MELFIQQLVKNPPYYIAMVASFAASICIHEYSHAFVAHQFGDDTAKEGGYLTLNPFKTMGWMSLAALLLFGISWGAVPVMPDDSNRLRRSAIALAGPMANLGLLCIASGLLKTLYSPALFDLSSAGMVWQYSRLFFLCMLYANAILFLFNILPVPILDGWGVIEPFLPECLVPSPVSKASIFKLFIYLVCFSSASGVFDKGLEMVANAFMPSQINALSIVNEADKYFAEENYEEAFRAYSKAAEQGSPEGMLGYAVCLFSGYGCEEDPKKSFEVFSKPEIADCTLSKFYLGIMYKAGIGCTQDYEKAYALLADPDVQKEYPDARANLANLLLEGLGTEVDAPRAYSLVNDEEVLESAPMARFYMAVFLLTGTECPKDEKRAFTLLNDPEVIEIFPETNFILGMAYYNGVGTSKDLSMAEKYMRKAAEDGNPDAVEVLKTLEQ